MLSYNPQRYKNGDCFLLCAFINKFYFLYYLFCDNI